MGGHSMTVGVGTREEARDEMVCECGHKSGIHARTGQCKAQGCDCAKFRLKDLDKESSST